MGGSLSLSCLILERPGRWRIVGLVLVALVLVAPAVPLLLGAAGAIGRTDLGLGLYLGDLCVSAGLALVAAVFGFFVGWPSGVIAGLYSFRGRSLLLAVLALPLVLPSFLLALGWSMLGANLPGNFSLLFDGVHGVILVFFAPACSLTALAGLAATFGLGSSQIDAARLAGGEHAVIKVALGHAAPVAVLAGVLAAVVSLGDPGPGQIFGVRTAASDLLISFSATYDFGLAGLQCVLLAIAVLIVAVPLAARLAPVLARATLARTARRPRPMPSTIVGKVVPLWLGAAAAVMVPAISLTLPMRGNASLGRALGDLSDTAFDTVLFGGGAALVSVVVGLVVAVCAGRHDRLRQIAVAVAVALFCLPPALPALGVVRLVATAPPWLDPLLRGSAGVCLAQGLRLAPLAVVLLLRAWGATSPSWTDAAAMSGFTLRAFLGRVLLPVLMPVMVISGLLVALLASADVGSVLLLAPPGQSTFALRIFTVMANAPQTLVAALCCVYLVVATAGVAVLLGWGVKGEV